MCICFFLTHAYVSKMKKEGRKKEASKVNKQQSRATQYMYIQYQCAHDCIYHFTAAAEGPVSRATHVTCAAGTATNTAPEVAPRPRTTPPPLSVTAMVSIVHVDTACIARGHTFKHLITGEPQRLLNWQANESSLLNKNPLKVLYINQEIYNHVCHAA